MVSYIDRYNGPDGWHHYEICFTRGFGSNVYAGIGYIGQIDSDVLLDTSYDVQWVGKVGYDF